MTATLYIGTDKGLFRLRRGSLGSWALEGPALAGNAINHVLASKAVPGVVYATASHRVWGARLHRSDDGGDSWSEISGAPHHPPGRHAVSLKSIWHLAESTTGDVMYAGIDPAGLFESRDAGATWTDVAALNEHASRGTWEPSRGIFAVHSINTDPSDADRLYVAISAGGAYRSDDGGSNWTPINAGVRAANLPDAYPTSGHNVHRLLVHPARPARLYRQCYTGTYRSDDRGASWHDITTGLPSDFGYALAVDPTDPDLVFQIPMTSTHMHAPPGGRLRVFRSHDAGEHWIASGAGLPDSNVWVSVLREAMTTGNQQPCDVYFGTTSGHVFASGDAGTSWELVTEYLARVLCITAAG